ncbi:facilitated trehalose transporter Tret1-like isoform X2 [Harmonia axyridis]|nr:facilitated trehalose transporter Tret1-like isoform X2 [Harmonia axyridis]
MSWSSPVLTKLNSTGSDNPMGAPLSEDERSWIASVSGLGSLIGVIPFVFLPDLIGRKPSLLLIGIPHMISFGLAAIAKSVFTLYVARFFSGISTISCYVVLPMYVAEVSENSNRGLMLVTFGIFSHFGSLLSYSAGPYFSMFWFNMFLFMFPAAFFLSFLLIAPESPYFHVLKKDYTAATKSLEKLGRSNPEAELEKIKVEIEGSKKGDILKTLMKKHALKGSLIALMLTTFQQLSGQAVFTSYTQEIFVEAGSSIKDSATSSLIVGSVTFFASFLCPFVIDKKGRRFVLVISITGIIIMELIFGSYYYLREENYDITSVKWLPLVCLMGYMLFFSIGMGPMPLTITSEILPGNIKFFVSTVSGIFGTISSTLLRKNYYVLNNNLHYFGTIWLFAGLSTFLLIFVLLVVPETKGKSFSEILKKLGK